MKWENFFFCEFLENHVNYGKNKNTVLKSPQIKHTEEKKKKARHLTQEKQF